MMRLQQTDRAPHFSPRPSRFARVHAVMQSVINTRVRVCKTSEIAARFYGTVTIRRAARPYSHPGGSISRAFFEGQGAKLSAYFDYVRTLSFNPPG